MRQHGVEFNVEEIDEVLTSINKRACLFAEHTQDKLEELHKHFECYIRTADTELEAIVPLTNKDLSLLIRVLPPYLINIKTRLTQIKYE